MDIDRVSLIAAARVSARAAHDRQSITPRHVNSLVKFIFELCDAYDDLASSYAKLQRSNAAEQRNEAISDGQKCPHCDGRGWYAGFDGLMKLCAVCNGIGHF
jgi:hypothetical protein